MESFEGVCWNKFQHLLEIRMLELKMEANFEDGLETALKQKKFEYKEVLKTADFTLQNCFRPELLEFIKDVKVEAKHWNFESPAKFQMMVTFKRFKNFMAYLQHWSEKKVLSSDDVEAILSKPDKVEAMLDYVQPSSQSLSTPFSERLQSMFENSVTLR